MPAIKPLRELVERVSGRALVQKGRRVTIEVERAQLRAPLLSGEKGLLGSGIVGVLTGLCLEQKTVGVGEAVALDLGSPEGPLGSIVGRPDGDQVLSRSGI